MTDENIDGSSNYKTLDTTTIDRHSATQISNNNNESLSMKLKGGKDHHSSNMSLNSKPAAPQNKAKSQSSSELGSDESDDMQRDEINQIRDFLNDDESKGKSDSQKPAKIYPGPT